MEDQKITFFSGLVSVADRRNGTPKLDVWRVETKLVSMGEVQGVVAGPWGEVSEDVHKLLDAMTTSRDRVAGLSTGR